MKKILGILLLFFVALPVSAAEFAAPEKNSDGNINIPSNQSRKNLYAVGANITVTGPILGDLTAAGAMVTLDGEVEKDLMAGGGNLFINGSIGDDARIAGGNINISAPIAGDLLVAGGSIIITEKAAIGGDLILGGGNVTINAPVKGDVKIGGGRVMINSKIEGNINAEITENLTFGPNAEVVGKVFYKSPKTATVDSGARLGGIEYTEKQKSRANFKAFLTFAFVIKTIALGLAAWLLLKFRNKRVLALSESIAQKPWESLGVGLLVLIAWPIITILLLVTGVGYYLAIILAVVYVLILLITTLLAILFLGHLALKYLNKPGEVSPIWQTVVIGTVLWQLLKFIPVVGWIACAVIYLVVLGAMIKALKSQVKENN